LLPLVSMGKPAPSAKELSPNSVQGWLHDEPNGVQIVMIDGQASADIIPSGMMAPFTGAGCGKAMLRGLMRGAASCFNGLLMCCPSLHRQCRRVVGLNVCLVRPESVGSVYIRSSDPLEPPAVDPNFLATEADMRNMTHGVATARALLSTSPLRDFIAADLSLGVKLDSANLKYNTSAYYHPTGTCSMGTCVDSDLRIWGLKGVRVADASVLPVHPRVGPAPACLVIGARCAELLLADSADRHR
jgi:choline dehydrogenase-like flavoprotein